MREESNRIYARGERLGSLAFPVHSLSMSSLGNALQEGLWIKEPG
jgi:hypothetical protein